MGYSGVYVFGDSLVDSGNALKLAEAYDYFPFTSLPDGAPTSAKGYYSGNFTNGWTFADLISNKYVSAPTKSVFPFGYDDPFLGISFGFFSDPDGNNLNFAYGGGQIRQGGEAVPDMDDQTDAYRDAVDGDADPNALHLFVFGANDVHDLVPKSGSWATLAEATSTLQKAANEYIEEILQTIDIGARHILAMGIPDIGIQPYYNGTADEAARRGAATEYAQLLDTMIQAQLYKLQIPGVEFQFVPFGELATSVLGTMAGLYGASEIYPLNLSNEVFFDTIHPTAQVHALAAAYMIDLLSGPAGERMALIAPDYSAGGSIAAKGEIDTITVSLAANTNYTFELLGLSTLGGNVMVLADPMLKLFGPGGTMAGSNDDGGVGFDATLTFTSGLAGDYTIQLSGIGSMTGSYLFQASGQAAGDSSYSVSHAGAIILEQAGGGFDTVRTSVSYALNAGAEVEMVRTSNDKGKAAINLTGNEFAQTIVGNSGNNIIEGKAGADVMTGGAGKDVFVLSGAAISNPGNANIDKITDYGTGDVVDISQILSVAAGTSVVGGGYVRVTTGGLVQVDVNGGANGWVTLSQINNGGAVAIRYLAGGVATDISVPRVSATSASVMASSIAAAGLAAIATTDAAPGDAVREPSVSHAALPTAPGSELLSTLTMSATGYRMDELRYEHLAVQPNAAGRPAREFSDGNGSIDHSVGRSEPPFETRESANDFGYETHGPHSPAAFTVAIPAVLMMQAVEGGTRSGLGQADVAIANVLADALPRMVQDHDAGTIFSGSMALDELQATVTQGAPEAGFHPAAGLAIEIGAFHPDVALPV